MKIKNKVHVILIISLAAWACKNDNTTKSVDVSEQLVAPQLSVQITADMLKFTWSANPKIIEYALYRKKANEQVEELVKRDIQDSDKLNIERSYINDTSRFSLLACYEKEKCVFSNSVDVVTLRRRQGYIKPDNPKFSGMFGEISLASESDIFAIGHPSEDMNSNASTITSVGSVYLYKRYTNGFIRNIQKIRANENQNKLEFGKVTLSGSGKWMAVGALGYRNSSGKKLGRVYIYSQEGDQKWKLSQILDMPNNDLTNFGRSIKFSVNEKWLFVQAMKTNDDLAGVYIFRHGNTGFVRQQFITSKSEHKGYFGAAMDTAKNTLFLTSPKENNKSSNGVIYEYKQKNSKWILSSRIKNHIKGDIQYGYRFTVDREGSTFAVGAIARNRDLDSGIVIIYKKAKNSWMLDKILEPEGTKDFGYSLSMSQDGGRLIVGETSKPGGSVLYFKKDKHGAWNHKGSYRGVMTEEANFADDLFFAKEYFLVGGHTENGGSKGIGGDPRKQNIPDSGAVYLFNKDPNEGWVQGIPAKQKQ